jgi:hypothetical protein
MSSKTHLDISVKRVMADHASTEYCAYKHLITATITGFLKKTAVTSEWFEPTSTYV